MHVPSKAFGEFVEHAAARRASAAQELDALMRSGADIKVLDSRPFDEYSRISIPDRRQRARRRAGAARARYRAVAGHDDLRQLRRPHAQHHRRAVADRCRRAEQGGGAAQRHDGLASRRAHLRQRQGRRAARRVPTQASSGRSRRPQRWRQSYGIERIDRATLERWQRRRTRTTLRLRRARPGRIHRRPCARRGLGARRPAGAGNRHLCRHARRPHRAVRRQAKCARS